MKLLNLNTNIKISRLFTYPVKSLGGIEVPWSLISNIGLENDRRFVITDEYGVFITQRTVHLLALFKVSICNNFLSIWNKNTPEDKIEIDLTIDYGIENEVLIWNDRVKAGYVGGIVEKQLSKWIGFKVHLAAFSKNSVRLVDPKYAKNNEMTTFSDGFPFLLIGEESLVLLNSKLDFPVAMNRFRPNIVFSGGAPHEEDTWKRFSIGDSVFRAVKPCGRCVMTTIDQETGISNNEPLKTLSNYRNKSGKILFGQNLLLENGNKIAIGDSINFAI